MRILEGKVALITGATKGLGKAIATRYAQEGAHLVLLGRNIQQLEALDDELSPYNVNITLVPFDLKDKESLESVAYSINDRYGQLDILVGNAGVLGTLGPIQQASSQIWENVLNINLTANWYLISYFDPLLRRSPEGRAIFVTSEVAHEISAYWSAYAVSKAALENMIFMYANENLNSKLKINLVDPGRVRTSMYLEAYPGVDPLSVLDPASLTDVFAYLASDQCHSSGKRFKAQEFKLGL